MNGTATAAFPHPTSSRRFAVSPLRWVRPAPVRRARSAAEIRRSVLRGTSRFLAFYAMTATLIVAGVAVHEYSHYAAHEGFGVPALAYSDSVHDAQRDLLQVERSRAAGHDVLVQQPRATTIVIFPNTFVQAAGLGLLPSQAYQDDGVLASTFFHLDGQEVDGLQARGGEMAAPVVAAPLLLAVGVFLGALAWTILRPSLFSKALLVAYAVQLGDAGHHATAIGLTPEIFFAFTTVLVVAAALVVGLRSPRKPEAPAKADPPTASFRLATRVVVTAPKPSIPRRLSVPAPTDNSRTPGWRKPVP
ncbi:MAG: hypothetical protein ABR562_07165 [Thermoplasmatota archaeon]